MLSFHTTSCRLLKGARQTLWGAVGLCLSCAAQATIPLKHYLELLPPPLSPSHLSAPEGVFLCGDHHWGAYIPVTHQRRPGGGGARQGAGGSNKSPGCGRWI
jgi:hypothetical protein